MNLLDQATDWTNQTVEERAEACADFLFTHRFFDPPDHRRIRGQIRRRADGQRDQRTIPNQLSGERTND